MPALLEVTIQSTYFNQVCMNVFNYLWNGVGDPPPSLSTALIAAMGWTAWTTEDGYPTEGFAYYWQAVSNSAVTFNMVTCRNIYSTTDFYEWLFNLGGSSNSGSGTGEALSPAMAYGFKSSKARTDIKRGARRMVGASEQFVGAGGAVTAGGLAILDEMAMRFSEAFDAGDGNSFIPCIVQKKKVPVLDSEGNPTGRYKYIYYPESENPFDHVASPVTWQPVTTVRTQGSRQYGRGR
jgi:hypothetical protein